MLILPAAQPSLSWSESPKAADLEEVASQHAPPPTVAAGTGEPGPGLRQAPVEAQPQQAAQERRACGAGAQQGLPRLVQLGGAVGWQGHSGQLMLASCMG